MLIIIIIALIVILCIIETWARKKKPIFHPLRDLPGIGQIILVMALIVALICVPFSRLETRSGIEEFNEIKETVKRARINDNLESAAIQHKIIDANKWLKREQYYANHWLFSIYYPSEINELEVIE